jgi:membrane protein YdbS with pleckstrin-like domain
MTIFKFLVLLVVLAIVYILVKHKILKNRVNKFDMNQSIEMSTGSPTKDTDFDSEWQSAERRKNSM